MGRFWVILSAVVAVIVVAAVAVPFLIPVEVYKEWTVAEAKDATGRNLEVGSFRLSLFPRIELEAGDVSLANAPGANAGKMAEFKELRLYIEFLPLLSGEVAIDTFVVIDPVLHLEVNDTGHPNWVFGETAVTGTKPGRGDDTGGPPFLGELRLGDIRLVNGSIDFIDRRTGRRQRIGGINMNLSLRDLDNPFTADGKASWNGHDVTLDVQVTEPRRLVSGDISAVRASIAAKPATLAFEGRAAVTNVAKVEGGIDLTVPSVRLLATWAGIPVSAPGDALGPMAIKGKLALDGPHISFADARISLDRITGAGDLAVDLGNSKPALIGRLDIDRLDLNPYLPPETAGEPEKTPGADGGWSDQPIDTSILGAIDGEFDLSVASIALRQMQIGRSALEVTLKDGLLAVDLKQLSLYGGIGRGRMVIDGRGNIPTIGKTFELTGVQTEPLLRDAAEFGRLSGSMSTEITVNAAGRSEREMVASLEGRGATTFRNGSIRGIDLAAMVRNVATAFLDSGADAPQGTDFAELSATYTISSGILSNQDLSLSSPLLRVTGSGTVDLPGRSVNYRIEPKIAVTAEGQGGTEKGAGVLVPVIVEGPWTDLRFRPELAGLVKGLPGGSPNP